MQLADRIGEGHGGTSGGRTVISPDGDAAHLEGKLVAHYHAGPLGATKLLLLMFEGSVFEDSRRQDSNTEPSLSSLWLTGSVRRPDRRAPRVCGPGIGCHIAHVPALVDELLRLKIDVLFATRAYAIGAAKQASSTVAIVGVDLETDPVDARAGLRVWQGRVAT